MRGTGGRSGVGRPATLCATLVTRQHVNLDLCAGAALALAVSAVSGPAWGRMGAAEGISPVALSSGGVQHG